MQTLEASGRMQQSFATTYLLARKLEQLPSAPIVTTSSLKMWLGYWRIHNSENSNIDSQKTGQPNYVTSSDYVFCSMCSILADTLIHHQSGGAPPKVRSK